MNGHAGNEKWGGTMSTTGGLEGKISLLFKGPSFHLKNIGKTLIAPYFFSYSKFCGAFTLEIAMFSFVNFFTLLFIARLVNTKMEHACSRRSLARISKPEGFWKFNFFYRGKLHWLTLLCIVLLCTVLPKHGREKGCKIFQFSTALYSRFHPGRYFVTTSTTEILLNIFRKVCKT